MDSVADLLEHSNHAHIARGLELHVVLGAVPERAVKRLANAVEGRILSAAATGLVKLEKGIQKQSVRQLLVDHAPRKGPVCRIIFLPVQGLYLTMFCVLLLKGLERARAAYLLELGAQA